LTAVELSHLIREKLAECRRVEIDGLGVFVRDSDGVRFRKARGPQVFIAYAIEDVSFALRLYAALESRGYRPWLDRRKLLPGQNWVRRIEDAISNSDFFVACFSSRSVRKRGGFQAEIRYALDCARRIPLDDVFMIPLRLDQCRVPRRIERETQYVDMFPDFEAGLARIVQIVEAQLRAAA
jgi:hypothetical protein